MSASNILPGKANSIALSAGRQPVVPADDRPCCAPTFTSEHGPQPRQVSGERLQPPSARPRREASATLAEARQHGLSMPERLGVTGDGAV